MCGINGFLWEDADLIGRMNAKTAHRGPDGTRQLVEKGVSLGHNRLAIIDLDPRSAQPMESADRRYVIVYNGEIYNFRELKQELAEYPFKTEGDTEVILAAYQKWGVAAFARLSGIFSFALWDRATETLTLVRDREGIKPVYYFWDGKRFVFSSELNALKEHMPFAVDRDALDLYFSLLYVPAPHTLLRNTHKLGAGMYATVTGGELHVASYVPENRPVYERVTNESVRATVSKAVGAQLVSDRPVGVFLSGGFDSSIVLHHVMEHAGKAETFTTGFELPKSASEENEKFNSDMLLARKTAQFYGTTHHEQFISLSQVADSLEEVLGAVDEPIANSANVPTYHLSKFARERVVVALDGSGGDELFGGYDWYRVNRIAEYYMRLPQSLRERLISFHPVLKKMVHMDADYYLSFMGQPPGSLTRMLPGRDPHQTAVRYMTERYFKNTDHRSFLEQMMHIHKTMWLVDESLTRTDKLGMAHGLEVRVPLLDNAVVALASRISPNQKATAFSTKLPLKNAYRGVLPEHIYGQPKRGWFPPGAKWLRDPVIASRLREILSPTYYTETAGYFDWGAVLNMLAEHQEKRGYHFKPLWALATFQVWARKTGATLG